MTKYHLSKGTSIEASRSPLTPLDFGCPLKLHVIHSCIQRAILISPTKVIISQLIIGHLPWTKNNPKSQI